MLNLMEQVLGLVFMLGGIVVSALALPDPARRIAIWLFSILGAGNLVLIIYTSERTPDLPHLSDLVLASTTAAVSVRDNLIALAENRPLQIAAALAIGLILGFIGPLAYKRYKRRVWYSSFGIFTFVDPKLIADADAKIQVLADQIMALEKERREFGRKPDGSIDIDSAALDTLLASVREASAKQSAAYDLREKALRDATGGIYEKLKRGELIAREFKDLLVPNPKEIEIPAEHWKFSKFGSDYKNASGKGIGYTDIEIARKSGCSPALSPLIL